MVCNEKLINKVLVRLAKGISVIEISKELEISTSTIYRWNRLYPDKIEIIKASLEIRDLIRQERYEEALVICNNPLFRTDTIIQSQKLTILKRQREYYSTIEDSLESREILNSSALFILDSIKNRSISLSVIHESSVASWKKIILTVAFYEMEKYSPKTILDYIKIQINANRFNQEVLKILKQLKNRMLQRGRFFDIIFYQELLLCNINIQEEKEDLESLKNDNLESGPKI